MIKKIMTKSASLYGLITFYEEQRKLLNLDYI